MYSLRRTNDGYVHFGDIVMLFNQSTDGCLACDPQETLSDETFATTSTWYTEPCSRNTVGATVVLSVTYLSVHVAFSDEILLLHPLGALRITVCEWLVPDGIC